VKIAFDTSVLVAAAVASHPRHQDAALLLQFARNHEHDGFLGTHALAELYSVLTKLPLEQRVTPAEALALIQALRDFLAAIPCDEAAYETAIRRCAERNLASGVVFDALHLVATETIGADALLTFNAADFERLQEAGGPRIAETL
jgi:predicted nucleic acid-binding protein